MLRGTDICIVYTPQLGVTIRQPGNRTTTFSTVQLYTTMRQLVPYYYILLQPDNAILCATTTNNSGYYEHTASKYGSQMPSCYDALTTQSSVTNITRLYYDALGTTTH